MDIIKVNGVVNDEIGNWIDEYKDTLEDNQSVIELVEKYNNCNFEV